MSIEAQTSSNRSINFCFLDDWPYCACASYCCRYHRWGRSMDASAPRCIRFSELTREHHFKTGLVCMLWLMFAWLQTWKQVFEYHGTNDVSSAEDDRYRVVPRCTKYYINIRTAMPIMRELKLKWSNSHVHRPPHILTKKRVLVLDTGAQCNL